MSLHPPREASRATKEGIIISKYPDVCRSPTAPVPYTIVAYQHHDANTASSVFMTGQRAHKQNSIVIKCMGDEPGVGLGVKSGTVSSICHRKEHSKTVRIEGQWATRDTDEWWMNNRNTTGKLCWPKHNKTFDPTPPLKDYISADPSASSADDTYIQSDEGRIMSDALPEGWLPNAEYAGDAAVKSPSYGGTRGGAPATSTNTGSGGIPGVNMGGGGSTPGSPANQNTPQSSQSPPDQRPPPGSQWWKVAKDVAKQVAWNAGKRAVQTVGVAEATASASVVPLAAIAATIGGGLIYVGMSRANKHANASLNKGGGLSSGTTQFGMPGNSINQDALKFKQTEFGKWYSGDLSDWQNVEPADRYRLYEKWRAEQERLKAEDERHSAPPHGRTAENVDIKGEEEEQKKRECGCHVGSYKTMKNKCSLLCGTGYQAHHIVPDYTLRYGTRPEAERNEKRIPGLPQFSEGPSICLYGQKSEAGSEHSIAHYADMIIWMYGSGGGHPDSVLTPQGTAAMEDITRVSMFEANRATKWECVGEIAAEIAKHPSLTSRQLGRSTLAPPKEGVGPAYELLKSGKSATIH